MRVFDHWKTWPEARSALQGRLDPATLDALDHAFAFAAGCHGDQVRPAGEPYTEHLLQVLEVLVDGVGTRDRDTLLTGLLHDVVEDTPCSRDEVAARFGPHVAELVMWVTKDPAPDGPAAARARDAYLDRLRAAPDDAIAVKLADRLSNVQKLDEHPRVEKQRSYARETIDRVVPLTARDPWFARWFDEWRAHFADLAGAAES